MLAPLIPSIFLLQQPRAILNLSIITLYVKTNKDHSQIAFSYLYYLLHTYVVLYIRPSFMNKLFSYTQ